MREAYCRTMGNGARTAVTGATRSGRSRRRAGDSRAADSQAAGAAGLLAAAPRLALASAVERPPPGSDWLHEIKFDGYRMAATLNRGTVRLTTRNQLDWTERFPAIAAALAELPLDSAILDGEIVALAKDGRSDFSTLQRRLGVGGRGAEAQRGRLVYQLFDLLYLDGVDLRRRPLVERKAALERSLTAAATDAALRFTDHLSGDGAGVLAAACKLGLEGVISKRADSGYHAGRGRDWLKSVCLASDDFVIGGFTAPRGGRQGFGALLLGEYRDGHLVYVGKVGTGFSDKLLASLATRLTALEQEASPFASEVPGEATRTGVTWLEPRMVVEVRFSERTRDGYLRQARFRGLREDKVGTMSNDNTGAPTAGVRVSGVRLSSPDRVVYADQGVTKRDLAEYYAAVAEELLAHAASRPLSLVRCPEGSDAQCFYQKHPGAAFAADLPRVSIEESEGVEDYLYLKSPADTVALVQAGVLEVHAWGSKVDDLERPDQLVFDLDPSADVPWSYTKKTALSLRDLLRRLGLEGFLRTTGGKGLHVVVPLTPDSDWDTAKAFAKGVADALTATDPGRLTTALSKSKRGGKLFIDYLRNGRGATAIVNYSTRARAGAPVATPLRWDELSRLDSAAKYDVVSVRRRLAALREDPWTGFDAARQPLSAVLSRGAA